MCLPLVKGPKVMGQNNNHKSNFHFLILGCKSFAVNYSLKSGTHRHHQTHGFHPWWCSARPLLQPSSVPACSWGIFLQFCLQQVKCMLNRIQVRWLTWPLHNSPLLSLQKLFGCFTVCFGSLSICTVKRRPMSSEAFGWIWADNIARNTSEFILMLLSASLINKYKRTSSTGSHTCPRHDTTTTCFTDEVVCLGSWAVPFLLHTLLFPSLWYKLILVSSVHRMLFPNCEGFLDVVGKPNWPSCFWGSTNGYILWWTLCIHSGEVFSWLLTLTHIHLPPGECSWLANCVKGVFFTRERILRSSTTVVFRGLPGLLVLLSSRCVPSFKNVQQLFWPSLIFLLSLWWVCFVLSA